MASNLVYDLFYYVLASYSTKRGKAPAFRRWDGSTAFRKKRGKDF